LYFFDFDIGFFDIEQSSLSMHLNYRSYKNPSYNFAIFPKISRQHLYIDMLSVFGKMTKLSCNGNGAVMCAPLVLLPRTLIWSASLQEDPNS
jgi:hypothetical protein